jgi:Na+-transporting methylmalonyl-CoA/oxaloacetate decarboxylase gamma subunit
MNDDHFLLPIQVAPELGKRIMNKYHNLTDESEIYRVSIGMSFVIVVLLCLILFIVLHPGLKTQYFKDNKWPQSWQDEAITIMWRIFNDEYELSGPLDDLPDSLIDAHRAIL